MSIRTNWTSVYAARKNGGKVAPVRPRVAHPVGWSGGYKRKPPTGVHKCLSRSDMAYVIANLK